MQELSITTESLLRTKEPPQYLRWLGGSAAQHAVVGDQHDHIEDRNDGDQRGRDGAAALVGREDSERLAVDLQRRGSIDHVVNAAKADVSCNLFDMQSVARHFPDLGQHRPCVILPAALLEDVHPTALQVHCRQMGQSLDPGVDQSRGIGFGTGSPCDQEEVFAQDAQEHHRWNRKPRISHEQARTRQLARAVQIVPHDLVLLVLRVPVGWQLQASDYAVPASAECIAVLLDIHTSNITRSTVSRYNAKPSASRLATGGGCWRGAYFSRRYARWPCSFFADAMLKPMRFPNAPLRNTCRTQS